MTHYQVVATFGHGPEPIASLLECTLETGRTHQVRVHLASIGTPLIGDPVYGQGFKSKQAQASRAGAGEARGLQPPGAACRRAQLSCIR